MKVPERKQEQNQKNSETLGPIGLHSPHHLPHKTSAA